MQFATIGLLHGRLPVRKLRIQPEASGQHLLGRLLRLQRALHPLRGAMQHASEPVLLSVSGHLQRWRVRVHAEDCLQRVLQWGHVHFGVLRRQRNVHLKGATQRSKRFGLERQA